MGTNGEPKLNVGAVLRANRQKQGISLDEASRCTGVSKAMLGQIERDESSPTLSTAWKISAGLHIPMSELLAQSNETEYSVKRLADIRPVIEGDRLLAVYNIFPFNPLGGFDYLYIVVAPGAFYPSTSHDSAKKEYIMVTSGVLTMHIGEKIYDLGPGDSISFAGDEKHIYENRGTEDAIFHNIVHY